MAQPTWIPNTLRDLLPGLEPWIEGRANDPLAARLQDLFAPLEVVHFVGLFTLSAAVILISLRLLGTGLVEAPASATARTMRPWLNLGLALAAFNIPGRSAAPDTTTGARLIGYATILAWVSVGAGGRWIGLT